MRNMRSTGWLVMVLFVVISIFLSTAPAHAGTVQVSVVDSPGDFDHVWITVKSIWFHTSDHADPRAFGWHKYTLLRPVTVDLVGVSHGHLQTLWKNIQLPNGIY